jgi:hypothetical protein
LIKLFVNVYLFSTQIVSKSQAMKLIVFISLFVLAFAEFDPQTFDWSNVKPITEIKEYREAFPSRFVDVPIDDEARVFNRNGRIIRGDLAAPSDFPWAVGLVISFTLDNGWCSGSLVSRTFVLSAGSCFVGSETQITALLGASDITRVSEFLLVTNYIKHSELNNNLDNDIALLRLQREVQINANVQIIRLPNFRQRDTHFERQKVFVAG